MDNRNWRDTVIEQIIQDKRNAFVEGVLLGTAVGLLIFLGVVLGA